MYNFFYVLAFVLRSLVVILRLFLCYFFIKFYYIIVVQTLTVCVIYSAFERRHSKRPKAEEQKL